MSKKINEYSEEVRERSPAKTPEETMETRVEEAIDLLKSMSNALDALVYYATPSRSPGTAGLEKSIGSSLTQLGSGLSENQIKGSELKQIVAEELANMMREYRANPSRPQDRSFWQKIRDDRRHRRQEREPPRVSGFGPSREERIQSAGKEIAADVADSIEGLAGLEEQQKHALGGPSNPYEKYSMSNLVSLTGDTPEDIVQEMQEAGIEITDETAARAAMNAGVVDDDLPDFVDAIMEIAHHGDTMLHEGRSARVRASWKSPLSEPLYEMIEQSVEASGISGLGKMWEYDRILVDEVDEWFAEGHFGEDPEEFERAKMEVFQYVKAMFP